MTRELVHDMIFAREVAEKNNTWVVIVVPDDQLLPAVQLLGTVVPSECFSGRTALLASGRVSIVGGTAPRFTREPFDVMLLGWGEGAGAASDGMTEWRKAARREVRRSL